MRTLTRIFGIATLAVAAAVAAAEDRTVSGTFGLGTEVSGPGADNAKYREFWFNPRSHGGSQFALTPALGLPA